MKIIGVILFSILFLSCSKTTITSPSESDSKDGALLLKIDKENTPADITEVVAFLSREGDDTLIENLNLLSENSADILFDEVRVGDWNLRVDALNSEGMVKYTGETDITVVEGTTIQVNLTLQPTGKGTGNIYLYVSWGSSDHGWIEFPGNPIFSVKHSPLNPLSVSQAKVLYDNGKYKMWFNNVFNSAVVKIGYAESSNGLIWNYVYPQPVLTAGQPGSWDDYSVGINTVIKDDNEFKMYYSGFRNQYEEWHIGLAHSSDGINWIKRDEPVLIADENNLQIVASDVIKVDDIYYMYYSKIGSPYYHINLATSFDGINWEPYENNPILTATKDWEGTGVYYPSVIFENNTFKMVYSNADVNYLGYAVSTDGKNWEKYSNNPYISADIISGGWTNEISYPYFKKFGNEYRIYFTGVIRGYIQKMGVLRKFDN